MTVEIEKEVGNKLPGYLRRWRETGGWIFFRLLLDLDLETKTLSSSFTLTRARSHAKTDKSNQTPCDSLPHLSTRHRKRRRRERKYRDEQVICRSHRG